jgi:hypothetical protein
VLPMMFFEFATPFHHMNVFRGHVHSNEKFAQELLVLGDSDLE